MTVTTIPTAGIADDAVTASKILNSSRLTSPLLINADMQIAQRATSSTGKTSSGYYACDRWHINLTTLGTWTIAQETLTSGNAYNAGFTKAFRMDCTTADASPAASDGLWVRQKFEGQNLRSLKKGTSSAEKLTATFWVKSNKTGTYTCAFYDHDNTRFVSQNYTISSADTWEKKVINFPADTSGPMDNDSSVSLDLRWYLGAGSNATGGTQATTWESFTQANAIPSNHVNLADSTSNDWAITGVQLELGEFDSASIPSFPFESIDDNLRRCCRYFQDYAGYKLWTTALDGNTTTRLGGTFAFNTTMRATPSVSKTNNTGTIDSQTITDKGYSVFAEKSNRGTTTNVTDIELDAEL